MENNRNRNEVSRASESDNENIDVNDARRNWRQVEDFGIAYALQRDEFNSHFDQNRAERRTMQVDTRLTKEEQKLEDQFAAEYYEQLRLDREKEDELLAKKLQDELNLEEEMRRKQLEESDEAVARRMQEIEKNSASVASNREIKFNFPPDIPDYVTKIVQDAHDRAETLNLPPNLTSDQLDVIFDIVKNANPRLAQEVKDYQIALSFVQENVPKSEFPPLRPTDRLLSAKRTSSVTSSSPGPSSSPFASASSSTAESVVVVEKPNPIQSDLINFDDFDAPVQRRPSPVKTSSVDSWQEDRQPTVTLAGVGRGIHSRSPDSAVDDRLSSTRPGPSHQPSVSQFSSRSSSSNIGRPIGAGSSGNSRGPSPSSAAAATAPYVNSSGLKVIPRSFFQ